MTPPSDGQKRDLGVNGLLPAFEAIAQTQNFVLDDSQREALHAFQRLYDDLLQLDRGWRPLARLLGRRQTAQGLYVWGAVGRGKSFLMDEFFRLAPTAEKVRTHFHRFMQDVHRRLRVVQGESNPLDLAAEQIAKSTRLLCLDEFHVNDIGDAMLMSGLLQGLFERGVVLMTTSNQRPDALYEHGLQRVRFLPAIELIKAHMQVVAVDGGSDYRFRALTRAGVYHYPLDTAADAALDSGFLAIAGGAGENTREIEVEGRRIPVRRVAAGTAWFDFAALCDGPRGTADYIELARRYHTVVLSGVPQFRVDDSESMRRFIWLVDEFYDRQVKLILSAEVAVEHLYDRIAGKDMQRTRSRLIEMQTTHYLGLPHLVDALPHAETESQELTDR